MAMAALALLEDIANGRIRRERVFRDHNDFLAQDDDWLISRFRFPRAVLLELCAELGPNLERETMRSHAIPVPLQVLTTLGFLATGSFQRELADRSGISQSSLSRAMPVVWDGIIRMSARYIRFPYDAFDQPNIKMQFAAIAGFPNVIGAIDCTHIAIKAPSEEEFAYVNRKHFHSINVQIICDAQMRLTNIVARWPGSTHDSYILTNSMVGMRLQAGRVRDGWLLGDRGYPLKTWLLTPLTNPQTARERRYNNAHSRTRSVVERAIGQLKCRWRCLDRTGGMLLYRPDKVCRIVLACGVLHNVAHRHGIPLGEVAAPPDDPDPGPIYVQPNQQAVHARQHVIATI
ncbi:putative nuclease HARBI1 [Carassius auratus]|uniref:Putative nuclease HARBI1 n=1 Tax=Carassius auratus TaxID=7957 RepID=A0A6P6LZY1_CARAU|nr:putative nuclease HARBI1 [Carassius auratus]XP_026090024.1 putative nuclease HARBI1 [Carassius auratus]XP_052387106.1 putative nuclease HARBI1 [Carassius gibelio]XP_052443502.1 putative nuclease HARBI1 [Carassius gibelio]XP_052468302.1 putative nuclease HARBI1 [Carassius gibelio]